MNSPLFPLRWRVLAFAMLLFTGGCGQKGPLYREQPATPASQDAQANATTDKSPEQATAKDQDTRNDNKKEH